jgi:dihydroorotate dehydrogenase
MIGLFDHLARPLLRRLDPETAHGLAVGALRVAPLPRARADDEKLRVEAFGLAVPNPVGLAAGFDKHAELIDPLLRLGFGFVEAGGVTPKPQPGNARPRLFRLDPDEGIINRFGFNSDGVETVAQRLATRASAPGVVGINLGSNKDTVDRAADYVTCIAALAPHVAFLTVNISSPNTEGLRNLQQASALNDLLARVSEARDRASEKGGRKPLLLKIAPDLTLTDLDDVVGIARRHRIDGMIVGNTTLTRPNLQDRMTSIEQGGLSGRPLFPLSTRMLAETYVRAEGAFPLIGVGGIDSGAAAFAKIKAGASLIQLYSGLVFRGIGLVASIKRELLDFMRVGRLDSLADAVGRDAAAVTAEPWPA